MNKEQLPINNQVEPDFLQFLKDTFKHYEELTAQGVEIGYRELNNFAFTLRGAAMNSHIGFKFKFDPRGTSKNGNIAITLKVFTDKNQEQTDAPHYYFECEI